MVVAQAGKIRVYIYIYASCAREYESKQRTTAVTGALQSFAFGPGEGQG